MHLGPQLLSLLLRLRTKRALQPRLRLGRLRALDQRGDLAVLAVALRLRLQFQAMSACSLATWVHPHDQQTCLQTPLRTSMR
jgi:hypothetical protein